MTTSSRRIAAAVATLVVLTLATACGGDDDGGEPSASETPIDCTAETLSPEEWQKHCATGPGREGGQTEGAAKPQKLGTTAETVADDAASTIEITPDTIVYAKRASGYTADNDVFAVVAYKADNTSDQPTAEVAPATGDGWKWITPDRQAIDLGNGSSAFSVTPEGFTAGGDIPGGAHVWNSAVFDLTDAQRGGTLLYTDGAGTEHRWTMPKTDSGKQVDKLKKAL